MTPVPHPRMQGNGEASGGKTPERFCAVSQKHFLVDLDVEGETKTGVKNDCEVSNLS